VRPPGLPTTSLSITISPKQRPREHRIEYPKTQSSHCWSIYRMESTFCKILVQDTFLIDWGPREQVLQRCRVGDLIEYLWGSYGEWWLIQHAVILYLNRHRLMRFPETGEAPTPLCQKSCAQRPVLEHPFQVAMENLERTPKRTPRPRITLAQCPESGLSLHLTLLSDLQKLVAYAATSFAFQRLISLKPVLIVSRLIQIL